VCVCDVTVSAYVYMNELIKCNEVIHVSHKSLSIPPYIPLRGRGQAPLSQQ